MSAYNSNHTITNFLGFLDRLDLLEFYGWLLVRIFHGNRHMLQHGAYKDNGIPIENLVEEINACRLSRMADDKLVRLGAAFAPGYQEVFDF